MSLVIASEYKGNGIADSTLESYRKTLYSIHIVNTRMEILSSKFDKVLQNTKSISNQLKNIDLNLEQVYPMISIFRKVRVELIKMKYVCRFMSILNKVLNSRINVHRNKLSTKKSLTRIFFNIDSSLAIINEIISDLLIIPIILKRKEIHVREI